MRIIFPIQNSTFSLYFSLQTIEFTRGRRLNDGDSFVGVYEVVKILAEFFISETSINLVSMDSLALLTVSNTHKNLKLLKK